MKVIETTAVFEGPDHLRLSEHIDLAAGEIRVILLLPQADVSETTAPDFEAAIGSYYRDYPDAQLRTADEILHELREGESP